MATGVPLPKKVREQLNAIRLEHKLSFKELGRMANVGAETVRRAINEGTEIRDFHQYALVKFLGRYQRGELKFENGKGVEVTPTVQASEKAAS